MWMRGIRNGLCGNWTKLVVTLVSSVNNLHLVSWFKHFSFFILKLYRNLRPETVSILVTVPILIKDWSWVFRSYWWFLRKCFNTILQISSKHIDQTTLELFPDKHRGVIIPCEWRCRPPLINKIGLHWSVLRKCYLITSGYVDPWV